MATGGRVLFHLSTYAPDRRNTILFTGFQAQGTRGAKMLEGLPEIKIHGQLVPVNAQIENIRSTSAHADYSEILQWLKQIKKAPKRVFIIHGELDASLSLKEKIEQAYNWDCLVPHYNQTEQLL